MWSITLDPRLLDQANKIKDCPLIEVPNRAVARDEHFYDVPKDLWKIVDLTELF